jgi:hypothetical protein
VLLALFIVEIDLFLVLQLSYISALKRDAAEATGSVVMVAVYLQWQQVRERVSPRTGCIMNGIASLVCASGQC